MPERKKESTPPAAVPARYRDKVNVASGATAGEAAHIEKSKQKPVPVRV